MSKKAKDKDLLENTIDKVTVEQRLFVYLKTFERFISQSGSDIGVPKTRSYRCKNTRAPYMTYNEAVEWIGQTESNAFASEISNLLTSQNEPKISITYSSL